MNTKSRIYLRALEPEDYEVSVKWRNDPEIQAMVGGPAYYVSSERERKWVLEAINSDSRIVLAICKKDDHKYIGNIMLQEVDWINRSGHVPILIGDKEEWSKGFATEARMLMLNFAFYERGLQRIYAEILEDNIGSIRLHEKCGYIREGVKRKAVFKNGVFKNVILMSILKEEFTPIYEEYANKYLR